MKIIIWTDEIRTEPLYLPFFYLDTYSLGKKTSWNVWEWHTSAGAYASFVYQKSTKHGDNTFVKFPWSKPSK